LYCIKEYLIGNSVSTFPNTWNIHNKTLLLAMDAKLWNIWYAIERYLIKGCYIDWDFSWLFSDFTGKWQNVAIINKLWYWMTCLHIMTHFVPALNRRAELWILVAISFSPWGPWYTAYMADMLASSAWAVQMLLVALSRLMCCSLVCKARRYASWPLASLCTNCQWW
jgi:hypothetical protein